MIKKYILLFLLAPAYLNSMFVEKRGINPKKEGAGEKQFTPATQRLVKQIQSDQDGAAFVLYICNDTDYGQRITFSFERNDLHKKWKYKCGNSVLGGLLSRIFSKKQLDKGVISDHIHK